MVIYLHRPCQGSTAQSFLLAYDHMWTENPKTAAKQEQCLATMLGQNTINMINQAPESTEAPDFSIELAPAACTEDNEDSEAEPADWLSRRC